MADYPKTAATTAALFTKIETPDTIVGISKALLSSPAMADYPKTAATTAALFAKIDTQGFSKWLMGSAGTNAFSKAPPTVLLSPPSSVAGRLYDTYIEGLPARPITRRRTVARCGGDTQTELLIAHGLIAGRLEDDARDEFAEQLTVLTLKAWQTGPADARKDLFEALAKLDPGLSDWLKAVWEDIVQDGPKAASKIANCTIECIDQALRIAAPADDVTAWIVQVGAKKGWMEGDHPTRRAKVMFVMRNQSSQDARLAVSQVESLTTLLQNVVGNLQAVKHGEAPSMAVMRSWVQAAEGALSQLLLHQ
jgi:Predicted pPIWI-associating nuclease